jgi:hypothetical protein
MTFRIAQALGHPVTESPAIVWILWVIIGYLWFMDGKISQLLDRGR